MAGGLLLIAALGLGGFWLLHEHQKHKHMKHHHMKMHHFKHHPFHKGNFIHHPFGRAHMKMHHVKNMIHQDIINRARHPHEIHRNMPRIKVALDQYEVMLRPLLFERVTGKISEKQFHQHLKNIEDQICEELQLPMRHPPHIIRKDFLNHDGSTTDMDNGHEGIFGDMWLSPDHFHFKRHPMIGDHRCRPTIHDLSARNHLAAFSTALDDDDIHHVNLFQGKFVGLARSNNVELADDYDFQHTPYPDLKVQDVFGEDGGEPI